MRLRSPVRRRPSPALVIALVALFISLGGASYAAVTIPDNSVGQSQLKNDAVSYQKIVPNAVGAVRLANGGVVNSKLASGSVSYTKIQAGAVGTVRANLSQLQARIGTTCGNGSAIGAVDNKGKVTCNAALPSELGTTSNTATIGGSATAVTSISLPAGSSYLAFANPTATVTSSATAQRVTISCVLTVGSSTQTRTATAVTPGTAGITTVVPIPLQVAGAAGTSSVACSAATTTGALPTTSVTAAINALQTAGNG